MRTNEQPRLPDRDLMNIGQQLRSYYAANAPTTMSEAMADAIKRLEAKNEEKS